ncbi:MAG: hypothetical protein AUJ75_02940 [Candidatus Omnitrophica bacterium CG1_02_49_10]|nr:MAG: hypothetical protein AUJ75_02940 [Candidatus Omnitrophica bacterium CG1_02_49_10]
MRLEGSIFLPIAAIAVNVISQILCYRYLFRGKLLKSLLAGFITGGIFMLSSPSLNGFIVYLALSNVYFHFMNMGETARRIRILRELASSKDGLTLEELLKRYNAEEIIERRLKRLMDNRQISLKNGRYYIENPVMLYIAKSIKSWHSLLF